MLFPAIALQVVAPRDVVSRQHADHAGHLQGRIGVNLRQPGVGMWAAHQAGEQQAGHLDVLGETGCARHLLSGIHSRLGAPDDFTLRYGRNRLPAHHGCRGLDGLEDLRIPGAAAQVAFHRADNLLAAGCRLLLQQGHG